MVQHIRIKATLDQSSALLFHRAVLDRDLDLGKGVWSKPASSVKQNTPHEAPLSAPARQLLSEIRDAHAAKHPKRPLGEYVFPSHGADGHRVDIKRCSGIRIRRRRIATPTSSTIRNGPPSSASVLLLVPAGREKEAVQAPVELKPRGRSATGGSSPRPPVSPASAFTIYGIHSPVSLPAAALACL